MGQECAVGGERVLPRPLDHPGLTAHQPPDHNPPRLLDHQFDHSTMAVATGHTPVHTTVEVPASGPSGHARLEIVANGIASDPVEVEVK